MIGENNAPAPVVSFASLLPTGTVGRGEALEVEAVGFRQGVVNMNRVRYSSMSLGGPMPVRDISNST